MVVKDNMSEQERFDFFYKEIHRDREIIYAGKILQQAYKRFPKNIALLYKDRKISYEELYFRACVFSKKLKQLGLGESERVLILFRNSLEFYVAYFGAWQVGAVVVPLNIFLKEKELAHIINDSQAKFAIIDNEKRELFEKSGITCLTQEDMDLESQVFQKFEDIVIPNRDSEKMAALLYTSGTTGLPKGVMLSSKNIMTNVVQALSCMPFFDSKKIYCILPLFHCFAQNTCVWTGLFAGCTIVLVPKISRKEIISSLKHKPDIVLGVPALYGLFCLLKRLSLDSVEYFICGGDALPDKIRVGFALVYGRKLCNGYGLTETSPLVAVDLEDVTEPTNNIGYPVVGVQCIVKDPEGKTLHENNKIGELFVKGDNVMMGYYNEPKKTVEVLKDGWLATGDLAKFDENGKIIICSRLKDVIIHKGINIYPQEIENVILKHPLVLYVGVIGQNDNVYGQVPIAVVQLRGKSDGIEDQLRIICKKELAAYKVPRKFLVVRQMPLTATSKVDKNSLRKEVL